jgi:hypothetical protein
VGEGVEHLLADGRPGFLKRGDPWLFAGSIGQPCRCQVVSSPLSCGLSGRRWLECRVGVVGRDGRGRVEVAGADERETGERAEENEDGPDGEDLVGA